MADKKICGTCANYYEVSPTMKQGICLLDDLDEHGCALVRNGREEVCQTWKPVNLFANKRFRDPMQDARERTELGVSLI